MSAISGESGGAAPLSPYDQAELGRLLTIALTDPAGAERGYSESFSMKKTDIAANTAGAVAASRQILGGDVLAVMGWTIAESTGAAVAKVRLRDGNNASAEVIATIALPTNGSSIVVVPRHGIEVFTGRVFLEVAAGSVEGVLYWR